MKVLGMLTGAAALLGIAAVQPAHADLIGSQVTYNNLYPNQATVDFSVPQQTVTLSTSIADTSFGGDNVFTSTFTATTINVLFTGSSTGDFTPDPFNGWVYIFSGVDITGATVDPSTSRDFSGAVVTFDSSDIFVNMSGLPLLTNDQLTLDVTSAPAVAAVPEPASMAIFGTGLIVLGLRSRHKRKAG